MNPFFMVMKMEIPHFMAFVKPMKIPLTLIMTQFMTHEKSLKFHEILHDLIDDP